MKKNIIRKTSIGMTVAALAVAMSISAFAAAQSNTEDTGSRMAPPAFGTESSTDQSQKPGGHPPMGGMFGKDGQMGEMQRPENGSNPMDEIREKVDALEDAAAKAKINALLEDMDEAMEAERKLMDANRPEKPENADAPEAKNEERLEFKEGEKPELPGNGWNPEMMDQEGAERPEESEEMKTAREKVEAARKALETALEDAGIEAHFGAPDQKPDSAPEIPASETAANT